VAAQGYKPVLVNGYIELGKVPDHIRDAYDQSFLGGQAWLDRRRLPANTWTSLGFNRTHVSGYDVGSEARYATISEKTERACLGSETRVDVFAASSPRRLGLGLPPLS